MVNNAKTPLRIFQCLIPVERKKQHVGHGRVNRKVDCAPPTKERGFQS